MSSWVLIKASVLGTPSSPIWWEGSENWLQMLVQNSIPHLFLTLYSWSHFPVLALLGLSFPTGTLPWKAVVGFHALETFCWVRRMNLRKIKCI